MTLIPDNKSLLLGQGSTELRPVTTSKNAELLGTKPCFISTDHSRYNPLVPGVGRPDSPIRRQFARGSDKRRTIPIVKGWVDESVQATPQA